MDTKVSSVEPTSAGATSRVWIVPFCATVLAMMTLQMSSLGFAPLLPAIQKDFGINYSQLGLFTGLYGLVAIAVSLPAGVLARHFGEKRILTGGLLLAVAGLFFLSQASGFAAGLTARVVWLVGYRLAFVTVMMAAAVTSPASLKSVTMGVLGAMSSLASVIGAPFGSAIGESFGWRHGMFAYAGMALLGAVVFWAFYRRPAHATIHLRDGRARTEHASFRPAWRNPVVWGLAALGLANVGGFSSTFFVPSALKSVFRQDAMSAAYVISAAYVTAIFLNLLVGYLADRFNRWSVLTIVIAIMIPATVAMASGELRVFRIATVAIISLGLAATNQIYAIAGELLPARELGPVMGIVSLGSGVFGYAGPQALGVLRDWTGGFSAGWFFLTVASTLALIVVGFCRRRSRNAYAVTAA